MTDLFKDENQNNEQQPSSESSPGGFPPGGYPPPGPPPGDWGNSEPDVPNVGLNVVSALQILLCCPLPILGGILYFVWKDKKPKAAKSMLTVSLIVFAVSLVLFLIAAALGFFAFFAAFMEGINNVDSGIYNEGFQDFNDY